MSDTVIWCLLAGGAIAVELITGTFYLLMLALGLAAAAIAAQLGLSTTPQLLIAAAVGGGSVVLWHVQRGRQPRPASVQANRDVNLDIGEVVCVAQWSVDGTAQVKFRGANWTAVAASPSDMTDTGQFRITEMHGNRLVLSKI